MKNVATSSNSALKSAEKITLAKVGKLSSPKEVSPKPPSMPKSASGVANVGVAGTLAGTGA